MGTAVMIESCGPGYWIYGHQHQNVPGFEIAKTKMLTNQLGYVQFGKHHLFDREKRIAIL